MSGPSERSPNAVETSSLVDAAVTAAATGDQEQNQGESREQESHGGILPGNQPAEAERNGTNQVENRGLESSREVPRLPWSARRLLQP